MVDEALSKETDPDDNEAQISPALDVLRSNDDGSLLLNRLVSSFLQRVEGTHNAIKGNTSSSILERLHAKAKAEKTPGPPMSSSKPKPYTSPLHKQPSVMTPESAAGIINLLLFFSGVVEKLPRNLGVFMDGTSLWRTLSRLSEGGLISYPNGCTALSTVRKNDDSFSLAKSML